MTHDEADEIRQAMFHKVLDEGHFVQYIPGDPTSKIFLGEPVAYTVGRTLVDRPEFMVTGLPLVVAEPLLNGLVRLDGGATVEGLDGQLIAVDLGETGTGLITVQLIRADTTLMVGALSMFGVTAPVALQALWPRRGEYPTWENQWLDQPIRPFGRTPLVEGDPYA